MKRKSVQSCVVRSGNLSLCNQGWSQFFVYISSMLWCYIVPPQQSIPMGKWLLYNSPSGKMASRGRYIRTQLHVDIVLITCLVTADALMCAATFRHCTIFMYIYLSRTLYRDGTRQRTLYI